MPARVLGTCYVCGKPCWGRHVYEVGPGYRSPTLNRKGVIVRDVNGIRHGDCRPFPRGDRATLSDA
jgi:hypothetical protein